MVLTEQKMPVMVATLLGQLRDRLDMSLAQIS